MFGPPSLVRCFIIGIQELFKYITVGGQSNAPKMCGTQPESTGTHQYLQLELQLKLRSPLTAGICPCAWQPHPLNSGALPLGS